MITLFTLSDKGDEARLKLYSLTLIIGVRV